MGKRSANDTRRRATGLTCVPPSAARPGGRTRLAAGVSRARRLRLGSPCTKDGPRAKRANWPPRRPLIYHLALFASPSPPLRCLSAAAQFVEKREALLRMPPRRKYSCGRNSARHWHLRLAMTTARYPKVGAILADAKCAVRR